MEKHKGSISSSAVLKRLAVLFAMPIHQSGDALLLAIDAKEAERHCTEFPGDVTGLEAFVNHYHLSDFVSGLVLKPKSKRRQLKQLGQAVVTVWAERITHLLGERTALFYLGGREDISVRFHLERDGMPPWAPLEPAFLRKERMAIFRASSTGLRRIA
jgi:hypothetical protein